MRSSLLSRGSAAPVLAGLLVLACAAVAGERGANAQPTAAPGPRPLRPLRVAPVIAQSASSDAPASVASPVSGFDRAGGAANGVGLVHMLGRHAASTLAPSSGTVGALVRIPPGQHASDYGLDDVAPGIGRLRATPARIEEFGFAHPDLHVEVAPPLHTLLDRLGRWVGSTAAREQRGIDGSGVLVGVADTGLDVTSREMVDLDGRTRVAWLLDLSLVAAGIHPELEKKYGYTDANGNLIGAVLSRADIDERLTRIGNGSCTATPGLPCAPSDDVGHGTHVTGIAAARGAGGKFPGVAPGAMIVAVRATRGRSDGIEEDDIVRATQFLFDRADFEKKPMVVNLSIGSDFGPHDGTLLWEQALASYVGPEHPGRAIVAAAGNSGSIDQPIHQTVRATKGATLRVPVQVEAAAKGSVQIWITLREGADLKIGLDGPDGEWIAPVAKGHQNGKNAAEYNAGVIYGAGLTNSPIPESSNGAVVIWAGKWPKGPYYITLEGTGMADLYLQGIDDAAINTTGEALFASGVRSGTINLPATNPSIIGVGCTVNRASWTSISGVEGSLRVPVLDPAGGMLASPHEARQLAEGEVCWFSSAGPTANGIPKPEISAPGALVVSAMSRSAHPGVAGSVFSNASCPSLPSGKQDVRCLQIDDDHGIAVGTSMSAPAVAGVIALLLQKDPTLTQDKIVALLQAGAHRFRGSAPFDDQSGPGEVDAIGSLDALDQLQNPALQLPSFDRSWVTLSSDYVPADGSTSVTAIVELRTAGGQHRADFFDKARLAAVVAVDGQPVDIAPEIVRHAPGLYVFTWKPPPGLGGSLATFGATFDGKPIVAPRVVPIATDRWNAAYPSHASGNSCAVGPAGRGEGSIAALGFVLGLAALRRRRSPS
ncbi:MAG: Ser-type protease [Labilithrix sp.]|nr:Ser-type protease [Labilithrix sp.]